MDRQETKQNEKIISVVVVLLLVCLCMNGMQWLFGMCMFPDEFGYWASAASLIGYDWSEVASLGSYYSFGYSIILSMILKLVTDSILAYRCAVFINLVLQILSFFILKKIFRIVFQEIDDMLVTFLAGVGVLYPAWTFYVQMTMAEGIVFFVYVLTIWLALKFIDDCSLINGILMIFSAIYLYTVHMRTIGVLISVMLLLLFELVAYVIENRSIKHLSDANVNKKYFLNIGSFIFLLFISFLLFIICNYLKEFYIDSLFSNGTVSHVSANDYSGQSGKILYLLTIKGLFEFIKSLMGKLLYLGCASFGFGYIGIGYLIKRALKKNIKFIFIFFVSLLQFMVMCLYCINTASVEAKRFDLFLNGRYFDFAIPLLMTIGIYGSSKIEKNLRYIYIVGVCFCITALISAYVVFQNKSGMNDPQGLFMIGMNFFLDKNNFHPYFVIVVTSICAYFFGVVLFILLKKYVLGEHKYLIFVFYIVLVISSFKSLDKSIYAYQRYTFGDTQVADAILDLRAEGFNGEIIYLDEGKVNYIDNIQYRLRNEHIRVLSVVDLNNDEKMEKELITSLSEDALVLVNFRSPLNDYLSEKYDGNWLSGHFDLYYKR